MALNRYQRIAFRTFRTPASDAIGRSGHLSVSLQKAHLAVRPEVYYATSLFTAALATGLAFLLYLFPLVAFLLGSPILSTFWLVLLAPVPVLLGIMVFLVAQVLPDIRAQNRARDIDAKLPYGLNYISTMSSAGATPEAVFESLAQQPVYGEVANEAAWIVRDLKVLGSDTLTALSRAIDRTPSDRFQDLLQGMITTLASGGDLETYLVTKSEQFLAENRQVQKGFLESLGILAESFVTVAVAGPLFLVILLSVMTALGSEGARVLVIGYLLILVVVPLAQTGFAFAVKALTPEA